MTDSSPFSAYKDVFAGAIEVLNGLQDLDWELLERSLAVSVAGSRDRWAVTRIGRMIRPVVGKNPQRILVLLSRCNDVDALVKSFDISAQLAARLRRLSIYSDFLDDAVSSYGRNELDWTDLSVRGYIASDPGGSLVELSLLLLNGSSLELRTHLIGYFNLLKALARDADELVGLSDDDEDVERSLEAIRSARSSLSSVEKALLDIKNPTGIGDGNADRPHDSEEAAEVLETDYSARADES